MSTRKKILLSVAGLVALEALTFYAYSVLWLADAQPQGSRSLTLGAWVCIAAIVVEAVAALAVFRWSAFSRCRRERDAGEPNLKGCSAGERAERGLKMAADQEARGASNTPLVESAFAERLGGTRNPVYGTSLARRE